MTIRRGRETIAGASESIRWFSGADPSVRVGRGSCDPRDRQSKLQTPSPFPAVTRQSSSRVRNDAGMLPTEKQAVQQFDDFGPDFPAGYRMLWAVGALPKNSGLPK